MSYQEPKECYRETIPGGAAFVRYRPDRVGGYTAWVVLEAGGVTLRGRDGWAKNLTEATVNAGEQLQALVKALREEEKEG
jgi:hypothetical protein